MIPYFEKRLFNLSNWRHFEGTYVLIIKIFCLQTHMINVALSEDKKQLKCLRKEWPNKWYETRQIAFAPVIACINLQIRSLE